MPAPSPEEDEDGGTARPGSPYARDMAGTISFIMQLRRLGLSAGTLRAFERVSRETFAPRRYVDLARRNISLPLPCGQVMTAPFAAARMVAALEIGENDRILEIGTGSGYVSAILAGLGREVVSIERYRTLAIEAAGKLVQEGFVSVRVLHGDGLERLGLGRFERVLLNGWIETLPKPVIEALAPGGRAVAVTGAPRGSTLEIFIAAPEGGIGRRQTAGPLSLPALQPGAFDAM